MTLFIVTVEVQVDAEDASSAIEEAEELCDGLGVPCVVLTDPIECDEDGSPL